ncbi:YigZ family protein [Helicobacter cynogastricus]|uniref:YigZ family protein n=1 Tax=Helicobacter cynogastricus TaxID=329937 RepID=UPI000CF0CF80|nr:YigZ family protein [Helicobacter cynogastricus]
MFQVNRLLTSKHKIKGSIFLGFLMPSGEFEACLERLRKEHHKARHIVYAYRCMRCARLEEALHEDREPKHSAQGLLEILRHEQLCQSAVIVVRYFGGVLLGVGGLMKAYSTSVQLCIQNMRAQDAFEEFQEPLVCFIPYAKLDALSARAKKCAVRLEKQCLEPEGVWVRLKGAHASTLLGEIQ